MKKAGLLLLVLVILGGWAVKDSEAGQWCWQFEDPLDPLNLVYIRLSMERTGSSYPVWSLNGMMYDPGVYIHPLVGTMVRSADGTQKIITLYLTSVFDESYSFYGVIDAATKDGVLHPFNITEGQHHADMNLNNVKCSKLPKP